MVRSIHMMLHEAMQYAMREHMILKNPTVGTTIPKAAVKEMHVLNAVAQYCDLTVTGDGKHMRYVVRETEESVEFVLGESVAYINGVAERTGGNSFVSDGKVYIPLEFAKRCFLNLDITIDTKLSRITIVRKTDDKANYLPLDFPYKLTDASDKIIFGELDVDIQEQIIKQNQPTDTAGNN